MKIILITEYFPRSNDCEVRGGIEARAFFIARELAKRNDVTVLCARLPDEPVEQEVAGITVRRCGPVRPYTQSGSIAARAGFVRACISVGRTIGADVVDGYHYIPYLAALQIASACDIPRIATFHDIWLNNWVKNFGYTGVIGEVVERYVLARHWDHFITNSESTKQKLVAARRKATPADVVYNGIRLADYASLPTERYARPTISYVGRMVRYKRVDDLLRALVVVRDRVPDVLLKLVGSGPDDARFRSLATELGLDRNVEWVGYVEKHRDVLEILGRSHVSCLPSEVEGFGMVIIESMACGTPVVASALAPIREITHEGRGGLLYPVGDVDALATKLVAMLTDAALHTRAVAEARTLASEYDWSPLAERTEAIYRDVLAHA